MVVSPRELEGQGEAALTALKSALSSLLFFEAVKSMHRDKAGRAHRRQRGTKAG